MNIPDAGKGGKVEMQFIFWSSALSIFGIDQEELLFSNRTICGKKP